ncbi:hypothetical protein S40288_11300 [Stachybotrys chartarum IBT 40288]|nr:hypothetical protein S40288_11300 [Stachybotrys chartarum IBT 40288]
MDRSRRATTRRKPLATSASPQPAADSLFEHPSATSPSMSHAARTPQTAPQARRASKAPQNSSLFSTPAPNRSLNSRKDVKSTDSYDMIDDDKEEDGPKKGGHTLRKRARVDYTIEHIDEAVAVPNSTSASSRVRKRKSDIYDADDFYGPSAKRRGSSIGAEAQSTRRRNLARKSEPKLYKENENEVKDTIEVGAPFSDLADSDVNDSANSGTPTPEKPVAAPPSALPSSQSSQPSRLTRPTPTNLETTLPSVSNNNDTVAKFTDEVTHSPVDTVAPHDEPDKNQAVDATPNTVIPSPDGVVVPAMQPAETAQPHGQASASTISSTDKPQENFKEPEHPSSSQPLPDESARPSEIAAADDKSPVYVQPGASHDAQSSNPQVDEVAVARTAESQAKPETLNEHVPSCEQIVTAETNPEILKEGGPSSETEPISSSKPEPLEDPVPLAPREPASEILSDPVQEISAPPEEVVAAPDYQPAQLDASQWGQKVIVEAAPEPTLKPVEIITEVVENHDKVSASDDLRQPKAAEDPKSPQAKATIIASEAAEPRTSRSASPVNAVIASDPLKDLAAEVAVEVVNELVNAVVNEVISQSTIGEAVEKEITSTTTPDENSTLMKGLIQLKEATDEDMATIVDEPIQQDSNKVIEENNEQPEGEHHDVPYVNGYDGIDNNEALKPVSESIADLKNTSPEDVVMVDGENDEKVNNEGNKETIDGTPQQEEHSSEVYEVKAPPDKLPESDVVGSDEATDDAQHPRQLPVMASSAEPESMDIDRELQSISNDDSATASSEAPPAQNESPVQPDSGASPESWQAPVVNGEAAVVNADVPPVAPIGIVEQPSAPPVQESSVVAESAKEKVDEVAVAIPKPRAMPSRWLKPQPTPVGRWSHLTPYIAGEFTTYPEITTRPEDEAPVDEQTPDEKEVDKEVVDMEPLVDDNDDGPDALAPEAATPALNTPTRGSPVPESTDPTAFNSPAPAGEEADEADVSESQEPPGRKRYFRYRKLRDAEEFISAVDNYEEMSTADLFDILEAANVSLVQWQNEWNDLNKIVDDYENSLRRRAADAKYESRTRNLHQHGLNYEEPDFTVKGYKAKEREVMSETRYLQSQDRIMAATYGFEYDPHPSKIGRQNPETQQSGIMTRGRSLRNQPRQTVKATEAEEVTGKRQRKPVQLFDPATQDVSRSSTPVPARGKRRRGVNAGYEEQPNITSSFNTDNASDLDESAPKRRKRTNRVKAVVLDIVENAVPEAEQTIDEDSNRAGRRARTKPSIKYNDAFAFAHQFADDEPRPEVKPRRHLLTLKIPKSKNLSEPPSAISDNGESRPSTASSDSTTHTAESSYSFRPKRQKRFREDAEESEAADQAPSKKRGKRNGPQGALREDMEGPVDDATPELVQNPPHRKVQKIKVVRNTGESRNGTPASQAATDDGDLNKHYKDMTKSEKMSASMKSRWANGNMAGAVEKRKATLAAKKAAQAAADQRVGAIAPKPKTKATKKEIAHPGQSTQPLQPLPGMDFSYSGN